MSTEFPVVLDAATQGALGAESRGQVAEICISWLEQLSRNYDLVQKQVRRWRERMDKERLSLASEFSVLPAICPDWSTTLSWLEGEPFMAEASDGFGRGLMPSRPPNEDVRQRVDELLRNLITDFDETEASLREEEADWQTIIKNGGRQTFSTDETKVRQKQVDFLTLLTNTAISPDEAKDSPVAQQFAIGMASKWIEQAAPGASRSQPKRTSRIAENKDSWLEPESSAQRQGEDSDYEFGEFVNIQVQHDVKDTEVKARKRFKLYQAVSAGMVVTTGLLLGFPDSIEICIRRFY